MKNQNKRITDQYVNVFLLLIGYNLYLLTHPGIL